MSTTVKAISVKHVFYGILLLAAYQVFFKGPENVSYTFVAGHLLAIIIFGVLFIGVKFSSLILDYFTDSIVVYGEITNGDNNFMYKKLLFLIGDQMTSRCHKMPYICGTTNRRAHFQFSGDCDSNTTIAKYTPGFGTQIFNYEGKFVLFQRKAVRDVNYAGNSGEFIKLTTLYKNKNILENIVKAILPEKPKEEKGRTTILNLVGQAWQRTRDPVQTRQIDSVILPEGCMESIIKDIKSYLSKRQWYADRGIPHRRGYLLYGPPGNGKSSCIKAIAGAINSSICIMSLNSPDLTDDSLNTALNQAPKNSIILLEDIDAAFKSRKDENASTQETNLAFGGLGGAKVTFRGLLNALDGVGSMEGRIVFMTSNFADKLDPALIRPGRVDMKILIDHPCENQIRKMFNRFFPIEEYEKDKHLEIENILVSKMQKISQPISMSMIQGLFIIYTESPQQVIGNVEEYFSNLFSVSYNA